MKVSIVINNYNYARFVSSAIESALGQTWRQCEVIVVDDGSTDASWRLIGRYGSRVQALRQDNGGQGAAYNLGWQATRGEFVLFLDADDWLVPQAIERALAAVRDDVAMVSFKLRLVDSHGRPLGGTVPYVMHSGDVRPVIRRFGHFAGPPASGNLYRTAAIVSAFPLDAPLWRRAADTVPFLTAPFFGRVAAVDEVLGAYRLHRAPRLGVFGNIDASPRSALLAAEHRRTTMVAILAERAGIALPGPFLPLPWSLRTRALSYRFAPHDHPYPEDTRGHIYRLQCAALREWPGYNALERGLMLGWLGAALTLPRPLVERMAASSTSGGAKAAVKRLLGLFGWQGGTH